MNNKLKQILGIIGFVAIYATLVSAGFILLEPYDFDDRLIIKVISGLMTIAIWYGLMFRHVIKRKAIVLYYYLLYRLKNVKFKVTITIERG